MTEAFFDRFPSWLGSAPTWGMFALMVITLIKVYPIIQKNLLDARENRESRYGQRIRELEDAVKTCQEECEEQAKGMRNEVRELEDTIHGMRRNHIQEQISLISAIVESVDNPLLKQLLSTLQSVQRALPALEELPGVVGDAKTP